MEDIKGGISEISESASSIDLSKEVFSEEIQSIVSDPLESPKEPNNFSDRLFL